jgi:hypothetical protein
MSHLRLSSTVLATALVALLAAPSADAVTRTRTSYPNAAAYCQSAVPSCAGSVLRARPLAIVNEGASSAFVTCSFPGGESVNAPQTTEVGVWVINRGSVARTISCTLVNGYEGTSGPSVDTSYTPKSAMVSPGDGNFFTWAAAELPGTPTVILNPNFSCSMQPGTGVGYLYYTYPEDVGA